MKTKKYGVFVVLSAALLAIAMLVVGCVSPLDLSDLRGPGSGTTAPASDPQTSGSGTTQTTGTGTQTPVSVTQVPDSDTQQVDSDAQQVPVTAEMATLQININNKDLNARTILPGIILSSIKSYNLYVHAVSGTLGTPVLIDDSITSTTAGAVSGLTPGAYYITVLGYDNAVPGSGNLIVSGTYKESGVTATKTLAPGANTVAVDVSEIYNEGNGTFNWDITLPGNLTSAGTALMKLNPVGGTAAITSTIFAGNNFDLLLDTLDTPNQNNVGTTTLKAGYYEVTVTFAETGFKTVGLPPAMLYIAENLISEYEVSSSLPMISNVHTLTLNPGAGTLHDPGDSPITGISHASVAPKPDDPTPVAGYLFDGWFTAGSGGTLWDFTAVTGTKTLGSRTLYAQYTASTSSGTINITFNKSETEPLWSFDESSPISLAIGSPVTVTLETTGFTTITWYFGGEILKTGSSAGYDSVELDWDDLVIDKEFPPGSYYLSVKADGFTSENDLITVILGIAP